MKISQQAIDRPRIVLVGTVVIILIAIFAGLDVAVQRSPAINTAVVLVAVPFPGAEPTEVEEQITRKIEDALQGLDRVDFIASTSMRGSSVTQVIFLDGVDSHDARTDVEHLVNQIRNELPAGREIQPRIMEIDFESAPIMLVTLSRPKNFDERALKQIAEDVEDDLGNIPGVANTQLFGGRERELHVNLNPQLMAEYGLTIAQIRDLLRRSHVELPGGPLNSKQFDRQVVLKTKFRGVDDVRNVVVRNDAGAVIRLGDIAEVKDTYRRLMNFAQLDGRDSATIIVNKESNINTLATARRVKARVAELQEEYPHIKMSCTRDVSKDIGIMFKVLGSSAIFGGVLVLVILTWAMGVRISLLVLLAIPFSTAVALIFLWGTGIPISSMVIFSYILVLGMVVDGAIIVAENIHRHIERGEPPMEAAKVGIDEVGIPVIAADLTTVTAFLPMLMVPGIMGDFMGMMPKVVSVALLGSVLVDHFLIPVIASLWYGKRAKTISETDVPVEVDSQDHARPNRGRISRWYERALVYSLEHRWVVMASCAMAVAWAFAMVQLGIIRKTFFPQSDYGQFEVNFELPLGYSIGQTIEAAKVITDPLQDLVKSGELVHFVTAIGSSGGLANRLESDPAAGPEFGKVMCELVPAMDRQRHQREIIRELQSKIKPTPGMIYRIEEAEEGPPGGFDVAVRLTGKNLDRLGEMAQELVQKMNGVKGTIEIGTDYRPFSPEITIEPNPDVVGLFGVSEADVAQAVQTAVLGDSTIELSLDDEDVTLRIQVAPRFQRHKDSLTGILLTSPSGRRTTIGELCDVRRRNGLFSVNRYEHNRAVVVRCDVKSEEKVVPDDVFRVLRNDILPEYGFRPVRGDTMSYLGMPHTPAEGMRATFTGENEERDKNMVYLMRSMIVGVVLIASILVVQFNSFRQAAIVLLAVPLSFVGVIFGMWVYDFTFSLASFIGLVALTGIVVNDAIVLVDFANRSRARGMGINEALVEAGINRLRPVILTTATTIGGMWPLFRNWSGGAEFWQPLCGAVIFGLAFATVLTLLVIPVAYSLAYSWHESLAHTHGRVAGMLRGRQSRPLTEAAPRK